MCADCFSGLFRRMFLLIYHFQQSILSALNFISTNSRYCNLVETAISRNPYAEFVRDLFKQYGKVCVLGLVNMRIADYVIKFY